MALNKYWAPCGVQDAPYSLEISGTNPGYVTADRDRGFLGGCAQLFECRPGMVVLLWSAVRKMTNWQEHVLENACSTYHFPRGLQRGIHGSLHISDPCGRQGACGSAVEPPDLCFLRRYGSGGLAVDPHLDVDGSSLGYSTADRGRKFSGGGAQLAPEGGERGLGLVEAAVDAAPEADLLEETEKLMKEKVEMQRQAEKENDELLKQVKMLESELEEQVNKVIEIEQEKAAELMDLRQQILALEKQLEKNRKFLDCAQLLSVSSAHRNPPVTRGTEAGARVLRKRSPDNPSFYTLRIHSEATRPIAPEETQIWRLHCRTTGTLSATGVADVQDSAVWSLREQAPGCPKICKPAPESPGTRVGLAIGALFVLKSGSPSPPVLPARERPWQQLHAASRPRIPPSVVFAEGAVWNLLAVACPTEAAGSVTPTLDAVNDSLSGLGGPVRLGMESGNDEAGAAVYPETSIGSLEWSAGPSSSPLAPGSAAQPSFGVSVATQMESACTYMGKEIGTSSVTVCLLGNSPSSGVA
ncbi:AKAP9 protein, partial [Polyodon spathula]|nr:AKAP9 protein [Polyodon spathula]